MKIKKIKIDSIWLRALIFVFCCAVCYLFLSCFMQTGSEMLCAEWDSAAVLTDSGEEERIDAGTTELTAEKTYIFTATLHDLPEIPEFSFTQSTSELSLLIDGEELHIQTASDGVPLMSTVLVTLPDDCEGKTLTMRYKPLSSEQTYLPMILIQGMDDAGAEDFSYANHTGIPAGFYGMAFLLLSAMLLLNRRLDWRLLPLMSAFLLLTVSTITGEQGYYFVSKGFYDIVMSPYVQYMPLALFVGHFVLNYKRTEKRTVLLVTVSSSCVIFAAYLISLAIDGRIASNLNGSFIALTVGDPKSAIYWLTIYAVFVSLACAVVNMVRENASATAEKRALTMREKAAREAYTALEETSRRGAEIRHELKSRFAAMSAMVHGGEIEKLKEYIDGLSGSADLLAGASYTDNFLVNAILQKYAAASARAEVRFECVVSMPLEIGIDDQDLASYLMNLLDNASEAATALPKEADRFIRVRVLMSNGFLTISCTNSCAAALKPDESGLFKTTKHDAAYHGFGLKQMKRIADKYGSVPVIEQGGGRFTVRTALKPRDK